MKIDSMKGETSSTFCGLNWKFVVLSVFFLWASSLILNPWRKSWTIWVRIQHPKIQKNNIKENITVDMSTWNEKRPYVCNFLIGLGLSPCVFQRREIFTDSSYAACWSSGWHLETTGLCCVYSQTGGWHCCEISQCASSWPVELLALAPW